MNKCFALILLAFYGFLAVWGGLVYLLTPKGRAWCDRRLTSWLRADIGPRGLGMIYGITALTLLGMVVAAWWNVRQASNWPVVLVALIAVICIRREALKMIEELKASPWLPVQRMVDRGGWFCL